MINWTSMATADRVLFNSEFHRSAWFEALPTFLGRFPDERHAHLVEAVEARSQVLPVGVDLAPIDDHPRVRGDRPLVLWNQRWEFDKGPGEFASAIMSILDADLDFEVALAGERYGDEPPEFTDLRARLGDRLVHDDFADVATYRALLRRADVVVSTAQQEFFGIAVTEAIYAGAFPVLPSRLVYPERIPPEFHAACLYADEAALIERLRWALEHRGGAAGIATALRPSTAAHDWSVIAPQYDAMLGGVVAASR
jgi:glycosyltransferase involved in cell wall biosynthesis